MKKKRAIHRVGFAAGSGITRPVDCRLHPGGAARVQVHLGLWQQIISTVMFSEALRSQDRYRDRLTLIHVLSRQASGPAAGPHRW